MSFATGATTVGEITSEQQLDLGHLIR